MYNIIAYNLYQRHRQLMLSANGMPATLGREETVMTLRNLRKTADTSVVYYARPATLGDGCDLSEARQL